MASPRRTGSGGGGGVPPARRYANYLAIDFGLSEVELRFGEGSPQWSEPRIHTRIVTSPVHLRTFEQAIQETIVRYERRFGLIPAGPAPAPDKGH
jgi:hypothetical protein